MCKDFGKHKEFRLLWFEHYYLFMALFTTTYMVHNNNNTTTRSERNANNTMWINMDDMNIIISEGIVCVYFRDKATILLHGSEMDV